MVMYLRVDFELPEGNCSNATITDTGIHICIRNMGHSIEPPNELHYCADGLKWWKSDFVVLDITHKDPHPKAPTWGPTLIKSGGD